MKDKIFKFANIIRYIGCALAVLTGLVVIFVIATREDFFTQNRMLYYSFLLFLLLYAQVWHLTRKLDKNLDSFIAAHLIGILYFIFTLLYLF